MFHRIVLTKIAFLLFLLSASSCNDDTVEVSTDPANLTINVTIAEDNRTVQIQANAENTVEYALFLEDSDEPEEINFTGLFSLEFFHSGVYSIQIRAYGITGRYLRADRQITIPEPEEVPVEQGYFTPLEYDGYELIWNDEFEGNTLNTNFWGYDLGTGCPNCGWGNNELQYYTSQNATVEDGVLTIEAREETIGNNNYTSSRIKTQGKFDFKYGRVDIRALLPKGQGIWPALWALGSNFSTVGWPKCGEIDIMEMIGGNGRENTVHGTLHWDNGGHTYTGGSYKLSQGIFADEYHVFSIIWTENSIKWLVNDIQFHEIDITPQHMTEFHAPFFFIFNVAVGGYWPGNPTSTTAFPQTMKVDYIRVFQPI